MDNNIFRKKSLDAIASPEDLDQYMRTARPPVWIGIIAILLLLLGAILWGCLSYIETKVNAVVVSSEQNCICYASEQDIEQIQPGNIVRVGDDEYTVKSISTDSVIANSCLNDYNLSLSGFQKNENLFSLTLDRTVKEGIYNCKIITERVLPISFLLNNN